MADLEGLVAAATLFIFSLSFSYIHSKHSKDNKKQQ
jgi:hypothetical protein